MNINRLHWVLGVIRMIILQREDNYMEAYQVWFLLRDARNLPVAAGRMRQLVLNRPYIDFYKQVMEALT